MLKHVTLFEWHTFKKCMPLGAAVFNEVSKVIRINFCVDFALRYYCTPRSQAIRSKGDVTGVIFNDDFERNMVRGQISTQQFVAAANCKFS